MRDFDYCFYHAHCVDGYTSAIIVNDCVDNIIMAAISYDEPFPITDWNLIRDKDVLFVDFCPDDAILDKLVAICRRVVIIDHHKTAMARLTGDTLAFNVDQPITYDLALGILPRAKVRMPIAAFDMSKSGARMTWEFFHPNDPVPLFVDYVMDYDLWQFKLPKSHEVNSYIQAMPFELDDYTRMFRMNEGDVSDIVKLGEACLMYETKLVKTIMRRSTQEVLMVPGVGEFNVMSVTCPVLASKVGNELAKISPSGIGLVYTQEGTKMKVSARSLRSVDLSPILNAFGGGGHAQAGGWAYEATG